MHLKIHKWINALEFIMKYRIIEQLKNVQPVQLFNRSRLVIYTTLSVTTLSVTKKSEIITMNSRANIVK